MAKTKKVAKIITRKKVVRTFKTSNSSKWEVIKAATGDKVEYFSRLTSRNGNILATGRGLNRAENAIKSIAAIIKSCYPKEVIKTIENIK